MIHLRLIVPIDRTDQVLEHLADLPGVAHLVRLPAAALKPPGDVVLCDVVREAANDVVEWLQSIEVHHRGSITIESADSVVSDAAEVAEAAAPGEGADALVWEDLEARARAEATTSTSYLVMMAVAAVIALAGILLDSPILLVGAMAVGPDYGPVAASCVALARRRWSTAGRSVGSLAIGLGVAATASLIAAVVFKATGLAPDTYVSDRQLTAFISRPDGMAAVVAVFAGIAGMVALTQSRVGALVGVLVSVTTIPAAANVGAAAAYAEWSDLGGAALQLAINVLGLTVAGVVTLQVLAASTVRRGA
ncbi:MAG: DUF389 domain-containing protein [Acidimicrobiales bacterium]|nr:DUF389 domain-containing protein [Acidimicrobiales bacterium]